MKKRIQTLVMLAMAAAAAFAAQPGPVAEYWDDNPIDRPLGKIWRLTALKTDRPTASRDDAKTLQKAWSLTLQRTDASPLRPQPLNQEARLYLRWDAATLYLAAEVNDTDHFNAHTGKNIWDGDCVQIAVVRDRVWQEFAVALTPRGPEAYRWQIKPVPESEWKHAGDGSVTEDLKAVAKQSGDHMYYAVSIPASLLGSKPFAKGEEIRFNVAVFDRGRGWPRISDYTVLADGICNGKFMASFAYLKLVETPAQMRPVAVNQTEQPPPSFVSGNETPLCRSEVAFLGDDPAGATASVFKSIYSHGFYSSRIRFFDLRKPIDWAQVNKFEKLAILPTNMAAVEGMDWDKVRGFVAGGKRAVLDLRVYAKMIGTQVVTEEVEIDSPWTKFQLLSPQEQTPEARKQAAVDEENLNIPLAVIEQENPLSAGFGKGSEAPWCGFKPSGKFKHVFTQSQIPPDKLSSAVTVVARSNIGKKGALWLSHVMGQGTLCAVDVASLTEPTLQWEDRGSYYKYAVIQNGLGSGLRYGWYFNRRLKYADYVAELKKLAESHPNLKLTVEGFDNGYNRYGLCIGNPNGPIYLYTGMLHCRGEYRSGMYGLYAFAKYLAEHAAEEPLKNRLAKVGVKIIPVVVPEWYVGGDYSKLQGKEEPLQVSNWGGATNEVALAIQQHHGAGPLVVGFGFSLGHGGAWCAAIANHAMHGLYYTAPSAYWSIWEPNPRPTPINVPGGFDPNPPIWDGYFGQTPFYGGLVNIKAEKVRQAGLNVLAEHSVFGASPAFDNFDVPIREYNSALLTDQSVAYLLSSVIVERIPD